MIHRYPLVSIIMPNYNKEPYIKQAIDSVISQSWKNWELIIIDDQSTKGSVKIIEKYVQKESRIKFIPLSKKCLSSGIVRNIGISNATGKFLAFLDSDDKWHPEKLTKQISYMIENNATICTTHTEIIDLNNNVIGSYEPSLLKVSLNEMLKENFITTSAIILDYEKISQLEFSQDKYFQDYICWMQLMQKGHEIFIFPEKLTLYRIENRFYIIKKLLKSHLRYKIYRKHLGYSPFCSYIFFIHYMHTGLKKSLHYLGKKK